MNESILANSLQVEDHNLPDQDIGMTEFNNTPIETSNKIEIDFAITQYSAGGAMLPSLPTIEDYNFPLNPNIPTIEDLIPELPQLLDEEESNYHTIIHSSEGLNLTSGPPIFSSNITGIQFSNEKILESLENCLENLNFNGTAALTHVQLTPLLMTYNPDHITHNTDIIQSIVIQILPAIHSFGVTKIGSSFVPIEKVRKEVFTVLTFQRKEKDPALKKEKKNYYKSVKLLREALALNNSSADNSTADAVEPEPDINGDDV
jgi:hypothetical protein